MTQNLARAAPNLAEVLVSFPLFCANVLKWDTAIARCGAVDGARSTEPRDVHGTGFAVVRIPVGLWHRAFW